MDDTSAHHLSPYSVLSPLIKHGPWSLVSFVALLIAGICAILGAVRRMRSGRTKEFLDLGAKMGQSPSIPEDVDSAFEVLSTISGR